MLDLGLLEGTLDGVIESGAYRQFYMHRTGHWLGLDVHDAGEYKLAGDWRMLEPGMVLTIEPGCYIRPRTRYRKRSGTSAFASRTMPWSLPRVASSSPPQRPSRSMKSRISCEPTPMRHHDLLIVGAGPVGLALALALKDCGYDIALADARDRLAARRDPRALALSHGSRLTLERLGIWAALNTTPIHTIHVSQQGGLGRTVIDHRDYDQAALGYVVAAGDLAAALGDALEATGIPILDNCQVGALAPGVDDVIVNLGGEHSGNIRARLVACAEGGMQDGDSGIVRHDYHQHALITHARAAGGHRNTAYERFTPRPLGAAPQPRWLRHRPHRISGTGRAADRARGRRLSRRIAARDRAPAQAHGGRGPTALPAWPALSEAVGRRAQRVAGQRGADTSPGRGTGFNLALRDVWALVRQLRAAAGSDPGAPALLMDYAAGRGLDRHGTIRFTDGLVRLFSNESDLLRHVRGAGLMGLDMLPPLRHFVAKRMMFGARAWP